jgi:hypothetical protein
MAVMENQIRHVNIRGYVRKVTVQHESNIKNNWVVKDGNRFETVPGHHFFHEALGGLMLRDSVEFKSKFPNHPIDKISVPQND